MMTHEETAEALTKQGYRRISNNHLLVSRVDCLDWKQRMANSHPRGMAWVEVLGNSAADHYRRCFSKDIRNVSRDVLRRIPGSGFDTTGYIPKEGTQK
jgi:hypothetical protein